MALFELVLFLAPRVGFSATILAVALKIAIQANFEVNMRGRVMSLWMM